MKMAFQLLPFHIPLYPRKTQVLPGGVNHESPAIHF